MSIKFGLTASYPGADYAGYVRFVKEAENMGFDSVWFPDHLVFVSQGREALDAWTLITSASKETNKIQLGAVGDPHRIHPAVLAHRLATVDQLSNHRTNICLGVGEAMNLDPFGIQWDNPLDRLSESMDVMRMLWLNDHTNPVSFNGEYFKLKDAFIQIELPNQSKNIPMYIATTTKEGLRLTGEKADGWIPIDLTPDLYSHYYSQIQSSADSVNRSLDDFDPCLWVFTSLGKNEDEAYKTLEPWRYVCIMQNQLEHAGYSIDIPEEYKGLNYFNVLPTDEERRNNLRELGSFFPREAVIDFTITGSKDDCIKKIERFIEKGVKHFIFFHYFSPDFKEAQRIYSQEIIPYFKG